MKLCLLVCFALSSVAAYAEQAQPSKAETVHSVAELDRVKFENLQLRERLVRRDLADIILEKRRLFEQVCKAAGFELGRCAIDPQTWTVSAPPAQEDQTETKEAEPERKEQ